MAASEKSDPTLGFVRPDFSSLPQYSPVQPLDVLAAELGLSVSDLVKLDANENLYGPVPQVRDAMAAASGMHIYPDPAQTHLRAKLAEYVGLDPEHVVAGCGSDELLDVLIRIVDPAAGGGLVIAPPTFGMYSFLGKIAKSAIVEVPRGPEPGFSVDVQGVVDAIRTRGARLVFIASPNNPTGGLLPLADAERILSEKSCMLVVDEAYVEFSGGSALKLLARYPNLVVLRTFSKWAGLAGMRVGFACAHPKLTEKILALKQPYNISVAQEAAAMAALGARATIMHEQVKPMVGERDRMVRELACFRWLKPVPSDANFVLMRVLAPYSARRVYLRLRELGVLVRFYGSKTEDLVTEEQKRGKPLADYVRISAGRAADTDSLRDALAKPVGFHTFVWER